ncbi:hypothetical protein NEHOM01_0695 [Nematocida homosporus]|uniref:uncharacterized protein n=1 Tax=Nematocida homosporus TaxID=1912981 RepID=UPI00222048B1|nr:uncharacterized protein NEHOM01_0695 [Nematocida homosporus]KAI5185237.1 hypothetical protein NEHOM01_0695 [Nematocida homosporus]
MSISGQIVRINSIVKEKGKNKTQYSVSVVLKARGQIFDLSMHSPADEKLARLFTPEGVEVGKIVEVEKGVVVASLGSKEDLESEIGPSDIFGGMAPRIVQVKALTQYCTLLTRFLLGRQERMPTTNTYTSRVVKYVKCLKTYQSCSFLVITKGTITKNNRVYLQCIDEDETYCEVILDGYFSQTPFQYKELLLLTNVQVVSKEDPRYIPGHYVFYTEATTLIERSPILTHPRMEKRLASLAMRTIHATTIEETFSITQDCILHFKGRILKVTPATRELIISDHTGSILVLVSKQEMDELTKGTTSSGTAFVLPSESLVFTRVSVRAVVLFLSRRPVLQSVAVQRAQTE